MPTTPLFTPTNTPAFQSGTLGKVNCQNTRCISVGNYSAGASPRPLLAISNNNGETWIYPSATNSPIFTPNDDYPFNTGYFTGASCINNACIVSGSYEDTNGTQRTLIAVSQDNAITWQFPSEITAPTFTPDNTNAFTEGNFLDSTCSSNSCIAVGEYFDGTVQRPLLALTQDKGSTWIFPSAINAPIFTPDDTHAYQSLGFLRNTYCEGPLCLAVGDYRDNNNIQRPLVVVSQDSGNTWIYPSSANNPLFTPDNSHAFKNFGSFNNISCQNNHCIASGNYQDSNNIQRPLVAISADKGLSWSFQSAPNSPIFTPDNTYSFLELGQFHDSSVTNSIWLPRSLQHIL